MPSTPPNKAIERSAQKLLGTYETLGRKVMSVGQHPCRAAAHRDRSADMRTWDGNPLLVSETFIRLSTEALPDVYEIDAHKRAGPPLVELQV